MTTHTLKGRQVFKCFSPHGALVVIGTVCADCEPELGGAA